MFKIKRGYSAGLIPGIIAALAAVFFVAYSVGGFFGPKKIIFVKFDDPGPLPQNMEVYFKGIKVGKITKMSISEDYKSSLLKVEIKEKDFNPPNNIHAEIKIQGEARIWAQGVDITKYVELIYPKDPSAVSLKNGDIIEGRAGDLEKIQDFLGEAMDTEDVQKSVDEVRQIMKNTEKASQNLAKISEKINIFLDNNQKNLDEIVDNTRIATENARQITLAVREFSDRPSGERGLRSTLYGLSGITENVYTLTSDISKITGNSELQSFMAQSPFLFKKALCSAITTLDKTNETLTRVDITLNDVERIVNRYDCFGACLSDLLSKRFLGLKLLFGRPGEAFEICRGACPPDYGAFSYYSRPSASMPYKSYPYVMRPVIPCPACPK